MKSAALASSPAPFESMWWTWRVAWPTLCSLYKTRLRTQVGVCCTGDPLPLLPASWHRKGLCGCSVCLGAEWVAEHCLTVPSFWCWAVTFGVGSNSFGQLGPTGADHHPAPTPVMCLSGTVHLLAVDLWVLLWVGGGVGSRSWGLPVVVPLSPVCPLATLPSPHLPPPPPTSVLLEIVMLSVSPGRSFSTVFGGERHSAAVNPRGLVVVGGVDYPLQPVVSTYLTSEHCAGVRIVQVGGCGCIAFHALGTNAGSKPPQHRLSLWRRVQCPLCPPDLGGWRGGHLNLLRVLSQRPQRGTGRVISVSVWWCVGVWVCGCVGSCECVSPRSMPFMHVRDLGGGFVQAALGRDHLVFLTSEGRVYLQGCHCHPDDVMDSPQLVEGVLWRHHIVQVCRVLPGV